MKCSKYEKITTRYTRALKALNLATFMCLLETNEYALRVQMAFDAIEQHNAYAKLKRKIGDEDAPGLTAFQAGITQENYNG